MARCASSSTRARVGGESGESAETAGHELDRVKRAVDDRRETRVRSVRCIALYGVVRRRAFVKLRIEAVFRVGIVGGHGVRKTTRVDAALPRARLERRRAFQIPRALVAAERKRLGESQPKVPLKPVIADESRARFLARLRRAYQRGHEVVIRRRFVGETLARTRHRNHAGLGALNQMRKRDVPPASGTSDTGAHAAAASSVPSKRAPTASPMPVPSPVLVFGAADQCGV